MPNGYGLLQRRAADVATYDNLAQASTAEERAAATLGLERAAALLQNGLSLSRNRAGDNPTDLNRGPVPLDQRTPYDTAPTGPDDTDLWDHAKAILDDVSVSGIKLDENALRTIDDIQRSMDSPTDTNTDALATNIQDLADTIATYQQPDAGALAQKINQRAAPFVDNGFANFLDPFANRPDLDAPPEVDYDPEGPLYPTP